MSMSLLGDVNEKLSKLVSDETCKDIEDFLTPRFDTNTWDKVKDERVKRHWRIVRDGHGRWREIKSQVDVEEEREYQRRSRCESKGTRLTPNNKLLFSNNILNSVKSSSTRNTPCSSASSRQDYRNLSTTTRSNIFPGVGNYDWHSQSNAVYSESALTLGKNRGHSDSRLREQFYGITRDEMGAWNEASVHHERMKKSWDVYLETLVKAGKVLTQLQTLRKNTKLNIPEIDPRRKEATKQVKKPYKKRTRKQRNEEEHLTEQKGFKINIQNEEQVAPKFSDAVCDDDDFWDFYEQPFVNS